MSVYTRKGDKGKTALYSSDGVQKRISKDDLRIEAIGSIDELNSYLGVVATSGVEEIKLIVMDIQSDLLTIGSILAGSNLRFSKRKTEKLEVGIDKMEESLPILKSFIIPSGSNTSSHLHYARALTRRAERRLVALNSSVPIKPEVLTYINRLSDFLFMFSRNVNYLNRIEDVIWISKK